MEALAIFGLACNVMQTISFAHEAIDIGRAIYQGESVDPNLAYTTKCLEDCLQNLQRSLKNGSQPMTRDSCELIGIIKDCLATGVSIRDELTRISGASRKGRPGATTRSWIRFFGGSKRKLEKLDKKLRANQYVLETQLLARVCKNTDAALIQSQDGFKNLDIVLQGFVRACAQGHTSVEHLIINQSASIKTHVSSEATKLQQQMREDVINEYGRVSGSLSSTLEAIQSANVDKEDRNKFLESLKYGGMDARRDHIKDPHYKTYEWVFHSIEDDTSTEDDTSDRHSSDRCECAIQTSSVHSADGDEITNSDYSNDPWEDFVEWLGSDNPLPYWVSGKAGSGKSTFMLFLTEHSKTMEVLNMTQKSPVILRHFIWTAGEPLQRSLKGILGKLLYDFLIHDDALCSRVLANFRHARGKSQIHEWNNKHLENLAFEAFSASDKGVCIFLDGVDEAEDQDAIIGLVKRLNTLSQVRICLSSRPEPLLLESLRQYPKLYMQDLSRSDIFTYTFDELTRLSWRDETELIRFVEEICDKANGVFLWACLVVELFRKGRCYGDNLDERLKYLEELPGDLQRLYEQMWERENSGQPGYKRDAAQYFNVMLLYVETASCFEGNMHVAHMVMALMPALATAVINRSSEPALAGLLEFCSITTARLKSRTAGLVEVTSSGHIMFIHRSVYEFLRNSDLGQDIMRLDTTNKEGNEVNLIKAYLASLDLLWLHRNCDHQEIPTRGPSLHSLLRTLQRFRRAHIEKKLSINNMLEILATAKTIYQRGHWKYYPHGNVNYSFEPDFLAVATYVGFLDYTSAEIRRLKLDTPAGMQLSARYKNYLGNAICTGSVAVPNSADRVASLIQALDDEPSLSRTPYNLISFGHEELFCLDPLERRFNLLHEFLSLWAEIDSDDEDSLCQIALQLYQAGFNVPDRILVELNSNEGPDKVTDEVVISCSIQHSECISVVMETTIDSLLRVLLVGYAKESEDGKFGVFRKLALAVNSSTAAFVFRIIALRNWPGTEKILIPADTEGIDRGFGPCLNLSAVQPGPLYESMHVGQVRIPGLAEYLDKISAMSKHITSAEFDEMVICDGYMFRTEEELQNWPPQPYSPIAEADMTVHI